ncbi:MAG: gamma-glutamyl-gamma-aminobutyrate hydrolase family protein [Acidimicrobiia bacterium]|nr:gamma-glutamyl-gamma-aminobutyrate hydrolase family protein [Acidimicrobiia bacterium]
MRPLIAVTGRRLPIGKIEGWREPACATPTYYLEALQRAGATGALLLPVPLDTGDAAGVDAAEVLERFDGLLLTGGDDLDPARYGQEPHPELLPVDADADTFELALIRAAIEHEVPTLAICRGIQVLNVALGGSLDQHITGRDGLINHGVPHVGGAMHDVRIEAGSKLAAAVGVLTPTCHSHHHQALDRLGEGLRPVAWAEDGIVEGLELDDGWIVGVQWHPEDTAAADADQQRLFTSFVERAAGLVRA